ncbi:MAG: hypothetical protein LBI13_01015 [Streptococcaceae bacterium]|nr:hypothetical protein [Streptococcaceae bacterium]
MKTSLKKFAKYYLVVLLLSLGMSQVKAESTLDLLSQQQELSTKINENRSTILDTQAEIDDLSQKIASNQKAVDELARQVQTSNPPQRMLTIMLSSSSLSRFIEQIVAENIITESMNKQLKILKGEKIQKDKALSFLNTTQVKLDQQSEELKASLEKATPVASFVPQSTAAANLDISEDQARANIVARESNGNYQATNGRFYGAYQLDISYLNGDTSPANQDATANSYVLGRYGSWVNAWAFWMSHGWY